MPKNHDLDLLKQQEQTAFEKKQRLWQLYSDAKDRTSLAYEAMQRGWEEQQSTRDEMNREWDEIQRAKAHNESIWDDYHRTKDSLGYQISSLKNEADSEHSEMQHCFDSASDAYEYGNKADAPYWSQQGHYHKDRRDALNGDVSRLCEEVKSAKEHAQYSTIRIDYSAHRSAKDRFEQAKNRHATLTAEFKRNKSERDRIKTEFDSANAEHKRLKEAFQSKLAEVKAKKAAHKQRTVDKINMALVHEKGGAFYLGTIFGENAKIRERKDGSGKTDVYFSGLAGAGDGMGHGHAVIDRNGNIIYLRDAWSDHDNSIVDDK